MGKSLFVVKCIIHELQTYYHIVNYQNPFFYLANLYIVFFFGSKNTKLCTVFKIFYVNIR